MSNDPTAWSAPWNPSEPPFFSRSHDSFTSRCATSHHSGHFNYGFRLLKTPMARCPPMFPSVPSRRSDSLEAEIFLKGQHTGDAPSRTEQKSGALFCREGHMIVDSKEKTKESKGFFSFFLRRNTEKKSKQKYNGQKKEMKSNAPSATATLQCTAAKENKKEPLAKNNTGLTVSSGNKSLTEEVHGRERVHTEEWLKPPSYWCVPFRPVSDKGSGGATTTRPPSLFETKTRREDAIAAASTCTVFSHSKLESGGVTSTLLKKPLLEGDLDMVFTPHQRLSICDYCRRPRRPTSFTDERSGLSGAPLGRAMKIKREEKKSSVSSFVGFHDIPKKPPSSAPTPSHEEEEPGGRSVLLSMYAPSPDPHRQRAREVEARGSLPPLSTDTTAYCCCHGRGLPRREEDETTTPSFTDTEEEEQWNSEMGWDMEEPQGKDQGTHGYQSSTPSVVPESPTSFHAKEELLKKDLNASSFFTAAAAMRSREEKESKTVGNEGGKTTKKKYCHHKDPMKEVPNSTREAPSSAVASMSPKVRMTEEKRSNAKVGTNRNKSRGGPQKKGLNCIAQEHDEGGRSSNNGKQEGITEYPDEKDHSSSLVPLTMSALLLLQEQLKEKN